MVSAVNARISLFYFFFHYIVEMFDERKSVDMIYLDFQNSFDKNLHKWLLNKLSAHNSGDTHSCLVDFLCVSENIE